MKLLIQLLLLSLVLSFYDKEDSVVELTKDNFKELVLESEDLWLVEFYAPWCGHCKNLTPEFKKAAKNLEGKVKLGALDMTVHGEAAADFKIEGYPTINFFLKDKKLPPYNYSEERNAEAMEEFCLGQYNETTNLDTDDKKTKETSEQVNDGWHKVEQKDVITIDKDNFDELVLNSEEAWVLEFYAPWCKHCKDMRYEYEALAKKCKLKGIKVGKLDVTLNHPNPIAARVKVNGYPTINFFPPGKKTDKNTIEYTGQKKQGQMFEWALREKVRVLEGDEAALKEGDVIILEEVNYKTFENSNEPWLIEYYAPWCQHCKELKPIWRKVATQLKDKGIKVAKVDSTSSNTKNIMEKVSVSGYPTIMFYPTGKKDQFSYEVYDGARTVEEISNWTMDRKENLKPFSIEQITSKQDYEKTCKTTSICIIVLLEHIYDTTDDERRTQLLKLRELGAKNKEKPVKIVWSQGGDQYDLEQQFHIGTGYPAVLAIAPIKNVYKLMTQSYSIENIEKFIERIFKGTEKVTSFNFDLKINKVECWDDIDSNQEELAKVKVITDDQINDIKIEQQKIKEEKEKLKEQDL